MTDVFDRAKRSLVMSRIRGRGNKDTEIAMARLLRTNGIKGWRRHQRILGRPDFVFRKLKVAIFVDGCFWHRCPQHTTKPKNNEDFWNKKLTGNQERDIAVTRELTANGWTVLRFWEHELGKKYQADVLQKVKTTISSVSGLQTNRRVTRSPSRK
jgi:DNA mismatch endonuclease (patch repair protein)